MYPEILCLPALSVCRISQHDIQRALPFHDDGQRDHRQANEQCSITASLLETLVDEDSVIPSITTSLVDESAHSENSFRSPRMHRPSIPDGDILPANRKVAIERASSGYAGVGSLMLRLQRAFASQGSWSLKRLPSLAGSRRGGPQHPGCFSQWNEIVTAVLSSTRYTRSASGARLQRAGASSAGLGPRPLRSESGCIPPAPPAPGLLHSGSGFLVLVRVLLHRGRFQGG